MLFLEFTEHWKMEHREKEIILQDKENFRYETKSYRV